MKASSRHLFAAGLAAALSLGTLRLMAQDAANPDQGANRRNRGPGGQGGDFNPEEMRKRMMERVREQFGVKDDAEWKLISERFE